MSAIDDGGSAFPLGSPAAEWDPGRIDDDGTHTPAHWRPAKGIGGMSIRDYFAAKAMSALISTAGAPCLIGALDGAEGDLAAGAYKISDDMLAARKEQP